MIKIDDGKNGTLKGSLLVIIIFEISSIDATRSPQYKYMQSIVSPLGWYNNCVIDGGWWVYIRSHI